MGDRGLNKVKETLLDMNNLITNHRKSYTVIEDRFKDQLAKYKPTKPQAPQLRTLSRSAERINNKLNKDLGYSAADAYG